MKTRIAVLVSGSGTNLQALIDAAADPSFPAEIAVVLSNRPKAYGLERARLAGLKTEVLRHRAFDSREAFDAALVGVLNQYQVSWVCLAGFMRLLTPTFLDSFPGRVLNIHPALLPAFPGTHGQEQALEYGVRVAGATVHFVDSGTDTGPIIAQAVVPVNQDDAPESLKQRILAQEHRLYPMVLRMACEGRLKIEGRTVRVNLAAGESTLLWGMEP